MKPEPIVLDIPTSSKSFDEDHDFEIEDNLDGLQKTFDDEDKLRSFRTRKLLTNIPELDEQQSPVVRSPRGDYVAHSPMLSDPGRHLVRKESGNALDLEFDNNVHRAMRLQQLSDQRVSAEASESNPGYQRSPRRPSRPYQGLISSELSEDDDFITSFKSAHEVEDVAGEEVISPRERTQSSQAARRGLKEVVSKSLPAATWKKMLAKNKESAALKQSK